MANAHFQSYTIPVSKPHLEACVIHIQTLPERACSQI